MSAYEELQERLREEFNARFDRQSTVLARTLPRDAYNAQRALCFEWYLSGFFDALTDGEGDEMREALEDVAAGRTTPIEEIRARLKGETVH